ncbi:MAG: hypothetical protein ACHQQQ_11330 [Bacteroidota bacterium]
MDEIHPLRLPILTKKSLAIPIRKEMTIKSDHLSHKVFVVFLLLVGGTAVLAMNLKGLDYYFTPVALRPFRSDYSAMRPSGSYSHGLGIIGAAMVIIGVTIYSSRKRIRALWTLGRLGLWLEIHIFLCLLGPILIIYHSTFKAGGIAAISLWTMTTVVASGVIGRFLYVLIPRNINGNSLTIDEIDLELQRLSVSLKSDEFGNALLQLIDNAFAQIKPPKGFLQTFSVLAHLQRAKTHIRSEIHKFFKQKNVHPHVVARMTHNANARASLLQKSIVLSRVERLFYYWHAIHLPFTIIMFITLALHVAVVWLLGYHWIY